MKLEQIRTELKNTFLERDEVVDGLLAALLAKESVLLLGPPGTAKSALAEAVCTVVEDATYFRWLLTKYTTPEEIFGPVDIRALKQGSFRRNTAGKLPEAEVVFLDEVFKASSSILNILLTAINEKMFYNDGTAMEIPMQLLVGASNELPENEAELAALYDRFLLRYTVGYLTSDDARLRLLGDDKIGNYTGPQLTHQELEQLQDTVDNTPVPNDILELAESIRRELQKEGITGSDRRWRKVIRLARAFAVLHGEAKVSADSLAEAITHSLWQVPDQQAKVAQVVWEVANPVKQQVMEVLDAAEELMATLPTEDSELLQCGAEINSKLRDMVKQLQTLGDSPVVKEAVEKVEGYREQVKKRLVELL